MKRKERGMRPSVNCTSPNGCSDPWPTGARLCTRSCYHTYSTELSARWRAEDEERESRDKYLGCPVCKQEVRFNCYHDGRDYSSVELDLPVPPHARDFLPLTMDGKVIGEVVEVRPDDTGLQVTMRVDDPDLFERLIYGR